MIDHFLKWADEATAIAAAEEAGKEKLGSRDEQGVWHWNTDYVLPNVKGWRISQDVTNPDGSITHKYIAGWGCVISLKNANQKIIDDPAMQFVLNRNGPPYLVENGVGSLVRDLGFEPVFAGSHYPIGYNEWLGKAKLAGTGALTATAT